MRNLFKKWWFWLIVILIILVILIVVLVNTANNKVGVLGISKEEFDQIEKGMTMTEVNKIINESNINDVASKQVDSATDVYGSIYKYRYEGEKGGYAIITYELSKTDLWNGSGMKVLLKEDFNIK